MALSDDDFIQTNEGFVVASTSVVASLAATTAGNTVVVFIGTGLSGITGLPTGFVTAGSAGSIGINCYYKSNVGAGETSWTFTGTAADHAWIALEVSNLEVVEPFDVASNSSSLSKTNGQTLAAPVATSVGLSTVQFGVWNAALSSGTATKSWGSYTDGFVEVAQVEATTGTQRHGLALARTFNEGGTGAFTSTATLTISTGAATCRARIFIFRERGAPISAPMFSFTGWEFGTHGGMGAPTHSLFSSGVTLLTDVRPPVGTWGTHYQVGSSYARNGGYGLHIETSAATCNVPAGGGTAVGSVPRNIRVVSGSGTATVATIDSSATDLLLVYDFSTNKYGLVWGAGTVSWQDGTTALNTWVWVSIAFKVNATTHTSAWTLETGTDTYTAQTPPADLTGQAVSTSAGVWVSGLTSQTLSMDVDETGFSTWWAAHPVPPFKVVLLTVDTGGTATVSGTAANFNTFSGNSTLAAFNSATALAALDEVPPTVSASADGLVQVTLAASDYVELPMQTYTLASDEVIAGVRIVAALWDGTGTGTGTLAIKGWDGTNEIDVIPTALTGSYDAASPTAVSSSDPWWSAGRWTNAWTQAKLNAACVRVGYSSDATPDKGVSAVYLEVAIRKTPAPVVAHRLTSDEDPEAVAAVVTETLHPDNSGVRTYTVSNDDATRTAEFRFYETGGGEHADSPVVVAPTDPPVEVVVAAEVFGEIESTTFGWQ